MQSFPIAPAGPRPLWLLVPVILVLVGVLAFLIFTYLGAQRARFELSREGLRLRGDVYGRLIPTAQLAIGEARRLTGADTELLPRLRTFGTGMPGYQAGWFRLKNGKKALLYLTDRTRAVHIPTRAGYSVLISPADPDAFLAALEALARAPDAMQPRH